MRLHEFTNLIRELLLDRDSTTNFTYAIICFVFRHNYQLLLSGISSINMKHNIYWVSVIFCEQFWFNLIKKINSKAKIKFRTCEINLERIFVLF